jgi:hypothetical protein
VQKTLDRSELKQQDGVVITLYNHEMWQQFGEPLQMSKFESCAKAWAGALENQIEANIAALAGSLQTKLILPAGNVFEFKSLNVDDKGHVYSLITYKTPTETEILQGSS